MRSGNCPLSTHQIDEGRRGIERVPYSAHAGCDRHCIADYFLPARIHGRLSSAKVQISYYPPEFLDSFGTLVITCGNGHSGVGRVAMCVLVGSITSEAQGCLWRLPLEELSSGYIGCPVDSVFVDSRSRTHGVTTWNASCRRRQFHCAFGGSYGDCSPALSSDDGSDESTRGEARAEARTAPPVVQAPAAVTHLERTTDSSGGVPVEQMTFAAGGSRFTLYLWGTQPSGDATLRVDHPANAGERATCTSSLLVGDTRISLERTRFVDGDRSDSSEFTIPRATFAALGQATSIEYRICDVRVGWGSAEALGLGPFVRGESAP